LVENDVILIDQPMSEETQRQCLRRLLSVALYELKGQLKTQSRPKMSTAFQRDSYSIHIDPKKSEKNKRNDLFTNATRSERLRVHQWEAKKSVGNEKKKGQRCIKIETDNNGRGK